MKNNTYFESCRLPAMGISPQLRKVWINIMDALRIAHVRKTNVSWRVLFSREAMTPIRKLPIAAIAPLAAPENV